MTVPLYLPATSGAPAQTVRHLYVTAGAVTFNSDAAWALYTAIEIDLPAVAGDWVEFTMGGMWQKSSGDFIDLAVVVSSSAVRYFSSNTATPAIEGAPSLYPDTGFVHMGVPFAFQVTNGDLDGANVRVTVAHKGAPGGGTLYSSSNYPLQLHAVNKHTVS